MKGFIYGQTEYNLLSSANRLEDYIKLAKDSSFDFLTITDNNLFASYKFYKECIKNNIKPIIGIEYEFNIDNFKSKVLMYAKNNNGYKNLMKISTSIRTESEINNDLLFNYEDIIYIYVFNDSYIDVILSSNDLELLNTYLDKINNKNTYIGISYTNKPDKINLNKEIENICINKNIKTIPIHQCLYLKPEDEIIYDSLRKIDNDKSNISAFDDYSFLINPINDKRIDDLINDINLNLYDKKIEMPKFPNTRGVSSKEFLEALCYKGLEKRGCNKKEYIARLEYELSVINKMGFNDYFLIVWDYIRYSKKNDILVGPGRGSGAASLVAYSLGITDIDPLKYNLVFERFLNPERVSMPDIDTDFPDVCRDRVIEYVKELYGYKHVCNITTFGTFKIKSAARDLAKVFNIDDKRIDELINMIDKHGYDTLIEKYKDSELYNFLYVAKGIENMPRNISTHPAGIIISDKNLDEIIPLQSGINGLLQAQYEKDELEEIGLLKMDFLGIRNLTMVHDMMVQIGFSMQDLRNIPIDDINVYKMLSKGDTLGIFQLDKGIKRVLISLKPEKFSDIVAVLALYRPGPMDYIPEFIKRRHGEKIEYIHKDLEPILKETYGIIVYQEQIMQIAKIFASYSLGEADLLRRAISKKDASKLDMIKDDFISRCIKNGYEKNIAEEIYGLIYKFAGYGFNKSHSVVYAMLAYQMAYFKVNYFNVFMSCMLNNVLSNSKALVEYIDYAKKRGLKILGPNVNASYDKFVNEKNMLFMPLNTIYSIGNIQEKYIIDERLKNGLFKSFDDFKNRCKNLSQAQIQALIYAGALDIFGKTKKSMIENSSNEDNIIFKHLVGVIKDDSEYDFNYLKDNEKKYLGFNLQYNIYININELINKYRTTPLNKLNLNTYSNVIASINNLRIIKTKTAEYMASFNLSDGNIDIHAVVFARYFKELKDKLKEDVLLNIRGKLELDYKKEYSFTVIDIKII